MSKKQKPYFIAIIALLVVLVLVTLGLNLANLRQFFVDIWAAIKALFGVGTEEVAALPSMKEFVAARFPQFF